MVSHLIQKSLDEMTNHQLCIIAVNLQKRNEDHEMVHELYAVVKPRLTIMIRNLLKEYSEDARFVDEEAEWCLKALNALDWLVEQATYGLGVENDNN